MSQSACSSPLIAENTAEPFQGNERFQVCQIFSISSGFAPIKVRQHSSIAPSTVFSLLSSVHSPTP